MVTDALREAKLGFAELGAIAATAGPGLIGGLLVGTGFAKGAAIAAGKPYLAINHLEAHALTARLPGLSGTQPSFPYLLLLLSGGHSQCVVVEGVGRYRQLGTTLDDAVGEAFDKTAKLLGLPYPGGPALEAMARDGDPKAFALPRPLLRRAGCDFSFSGLKTAVAQLVASHGMTRFAPRRLPPTSPPASRPPSPTSWPTAWNTRCSSARRFPPWSSRAAWRPIPPSEPGLTAIATAHAELNFIAPPLRFCTDNAVMVAWAAIERLNAGLTDPLSAPCRPRWPLETL